MFAVGFSGFFVFQSVFNYLPFRLSEPAMGLSTAQITVTYFAYAAGAVMGPVSGIISDRLGNGRTILQGSVVLGAGVSLTLIQSVAAVVLGLFVLCVGFFSLHSAAVGALNARLRHGKGRANALYVLAYYLDGFAGISLCGPVYVAGGWKGVIGVCLAALVVPLILGVLDGGLSPKPQPAERG